MDDDIPRCLDELRNARGICQEISEKNADKIKWITMMIAVENLDAQELALKKLDDLLLTAFNTAYLHDLDVSRCLLNEIVILIDSSENALVDLLAWSERSICDLSVLRDKILRNSELHTAIRSTIRENSLSDAESLPDTEIVSDSDESSTGTVIIDDDEDGDLN